MLRELDTQRIFTANNDAVRLSTISRPAALAALNARVIRPQPIARVAPLPAAQLAAPKQPVHHVAQPKSMLSAPR